MIQCNSCANSRCRRTTPNVFPKLKFKPGNKWDHMDKSCRFYQPINRSVRLDQVARLTLTSKKGE